MPQLSIDTRPAIGYAGQLAEAQAPKFARSHIAEGAAISAGMPVKRGSSARKVEPFEAADVPTAAMFAGVVLLETTRPYSEDAIEDGDPVSVLRLGSVLMNFGEAVNEGEQVGIVLATGVLSGIPQGTAAGAIATGTVVLPGLRIAETTSAAGLAIVEVNLFGSQDAATVGTL